MAGPGFQLPGAQTCGGQQRPYFRGTGVISGTAKVGGVNAPVRVWLRSADGTLLGFRRTGADGAYAFLGLQPGDYMLLIEDDRQWGKRPKVELVTVT